MVILVWPEPTLRVIAALIGIWLLVAGIVLMAGAVANHDTLPLWGVTLGAGIVSAVLGIWALRRPGQTLSVIIVLVGIWAIVMGDPRTGGRLRGETPAQALRQAHGRQRPGLTHP